MHLQHRIQRQERVWRHSRQYVSDALTEMKRRDVEIYKRVIRPILDKRDSEFWHVRAREALHFAEALPLTLSLLELLADGHRRYRDERLRVVLGG